MKHKKLLAVVIGLMVLILIGLLAVPLFVDSNRLKNLIITQLESKLQRKITAKEASVLIFTGPGIELRDMAVAEDPDFGQSPFVLVESLVVKAGILALLRGQVEISDLRIAHPVVSLIQNREGRWNYSSLLEPPEKTGTTRQLGTESPGGRGAGRPISPAAAPAKASLPVVISSLSISDGTLTMMKELSATGRQQSRWEHINLEVSDVSGPNASRFDLSLGLGGKAKNRLRLGGTLGPINLQALDKATLDVHLELSEAPIADLFLPFQISTEDQWEGTLSCSTRIQGSLSTGMLFEGATQYSGLAVKRGSQEPVRVNGEVRHAGNYEIASNRLKLDRFELQAPHSTLNLSGTVQNVTSEPVLDLNLNSPKASFDDLLALGSVFGQGPPKGVQAEGNGQAQLAIKGNTENLLLSGEAKFTDLSVRYPGLAEKIILSPIVLSFANNEMGSNPFLASVGDRTRLQCQLASGFGAGSYLNAKITSERPVAVNDLMAIAQTFGFQWPEGIKLHDGTISLQLDVKNKFRPASELQIEGQSTLVGTVFQHAKLKLPLQIHNAVLRFTGNSAAVSDLSASLGDIRLSGNIAAPSLKAQTYAFSLKLNQLNLSKWSELVNSEGSEAPKHSAAEPPFSLAYLFPSRISVVHAAGPKNAVARGPFSDLVIQDSSLAIEKVYFDPRAFTNLTSKVTMQHQVLEFTDLHFEVDQGEHTGTLSIDFSRSQPQYVHHAKLRELDANQFLAENFSLKNTVYGKLSSEYELRGSGSDSAEIIHSLTGSGKLGIARGRITSFNISEEVASLGNLVGVKLDPSGTEFEDLAAEFAVREERLSISNMRAKMTTMRLQGNGNIGFDKTTDCHILVELLSEPSRKGSDANPLGNLASGVFKNAQGNTALPLHMTGFITSPKFSLDPQAAKDVWKNVLRDGNLKDTVDTIQGLFKPKKSESSPAAVTGAPKGAEGGTGAEKPAEKKSSSWQDLLQGVIDQTKQKKKTDEKK
ncbi:MAG: AsmA-like C-terminal region-containing protein [Terriglobia bacterium]